MDSSLPLLGRSGKIKVSLLLFLAVFAALVYGAFEIGGVYWRQYRLEEAVGRELSFAGQRIDEAIRQRVLEYVAGTNMPISARDVRFGRVDSPRRGLRVSISYVDTANLLFTKREFPMSLEVVRPF